MRLKLWPRTLIITILLVLLAALPLIGACTSEEVEEEEEERCWILFTVEDTGIGIPSDKHETIFECFSQADGSHTRKFGGTGLGLAITKQLVELLEGRIWLTSEPGMGTTVRVEVSQ